MNLDAALIDYNKALELNPNDCDDYFQRGEVHYALNDFNAAAVQDYTETLRLSQNFAFTYH